MGTVKGIKAKLLVILIVFMIVFSNCGFTLAAIATSDGFQVITNGFFKKDEINFDAYFEDENGNKITEVTKNVNQKVRLILDILPQVDGYLKKADLKAVSEDGSDVNFKITDVKYYQSEDDSLDVKPNVNLDVNNEKTEEGEKVEAPAIPENTVDSNSTVENKVEEIVNEQNTVATENVANASTNTVEVENVVDGEKAVEELDNLSGEATVSTDTVSEISNTTNENVVNEISNDAKNTAVSENVVTNSSINNEVANETTNETKNEVANEITNEVSNEVVNNTSEEADKALPEEPIANPEDVNSEDILIDEDKVIEEKTEEATVQENLAYDMKVVSDNEIELKNIIKDTKIVIELEYKMGENLKVEDLMKNIKLQLSGTYINSDLEEVPVAKEAEVTLGWEYTKDVELTSEFTKFSPFEVGEIKGTIVENKISVKREITDEKYLPIKNTSLEVGVPEVNGKKPIEINVICEKLLATRGEDTGYTTFVKDNWTYDAESGKIKISVENTNLVYTSGMDEYVIIYRYEDMIDAENSDLNKNVKLKVEEFSGAKNHIIEKEIKETQNIKVDVGELITYNISSTEEKINKAKVYANYNNETPIYETEYTNQINVNILTSDILEELKINCNQEVYKDVNGFEFAAEGIEYKKIKFSFSEISTLLVNGGEIVITNTAGEVLYTLNKDIIKSEEDCQINLNGQSGIIIYARNIAKNGNLNFEVVKAIKGCNYEKSAFKNFTSIESKITAEVKYQKIEETLALPTIGTAKQFEEAKTFATLSLNKETLSTTKSNENVEIKIELNNDKEDSDLYVNPAFEVVFPKHVKNVTIQNVNVLYENGLRVKSIDTYTENDITKIRAELEGTQKTFSESSITNGTNIIINANIEVDEYTPKKEDQIKLYYCNEGASTYQSQTKWSISKQIPNGILKTTNGFDVAIIKYQAPNGLIAINGIVNYDGNLSEVKSVKQGEVKKQIDINSSAKIMTMELLALNNTDNKCTDVVLLGRIPFAGAKDVITHEDLKVTTNTVMKDLIKEDIQNTNTVDIYYSNNAEATKELDNIGNGWTKEVGDINQVKSFLIVVKGAMEAGQVLRYTYDFEVPASLPYETNIEGSFGAFYNNNTDVAVVYETSVADTVGLVTEAGPKLEAKLSVDIGDGASILSGKRMKYTVSVKNPGSVAAENVIVKSDIPDYTVYTYDEAVSAHGDNGFIKESRENVELNVGTVNPGETKEVSYYVTAGVKPSLEEFAEGQDENGYYIYKIVEHQHNDQEEHEEEREKVYITEVPDIYIKNKAIVTTSLFVKEVETNEVSNKFEYANFNTSITIDYNADVQSGVERNFGLTIRNVSHKKLTNVVAELNFGDIFTFADGTAKDKVGNDINAEILYDETTHKVTYKIGEMEDGENIKLTARVNASKLSEMEKSEYCYFNLSAEGTKNEVSTKILMKYIKSYLEAEDISIKVPDIANENDEIIVSTKVSNIGSVISQIPVFECKVSDSFNIKSIVCSNGKRLSTVVKNGMVTNILPAIEKGESLTIDMTLKTNNLPGTENHEAVLERIIKNDGQNDISLETIKILVNNNEKTDGEKEDDRIDQEYQDSLDEQEKIEEDNKQEPTTPPTDTNNGNNNSNGDAQNNNPVDSDNTNNDSSNDLNNTDNSTNNSDKSNNTTDVETPVKEQTYSITGLSWLDTNKDGIRDDNEKGLSGIKVYLLTADNNMLKSTVTSSEGRYNFNEVKNGKYVIATTYDEKEYIPTIYKKTGVTEDKSSDIIENKNNNISAVTNEIVIQDGNVSNINIGLQRRETFDLIVNKYISKITVENGKYFEEYKLDNLDIAKVEIPAKKLAGAKVTLEYTIDIENIGDIDGYAENLVDYIDEDLEFDESKNTDWFKGTDGFVYASNLNQTLLKKGDKKELKLVLVKNMTEENTGTLSNKVELLSAFSQNDKVENDDNNTSVQNTLILISTGYTTQVLVTIAILMIIVLIIYNNRNKLNLFKNETYKTKIKPKFKTKKIYK